MNRRDFIKTGAAAAGVLAAGEYLAACTVGQKRYKIAMTGDKAIIDLAAYPALQQVGGSGIFVVRDHPTLIVVHTDTGYVAFGANCTHKRCVVDWHDSEKHFICPCHKGRYDITGAVVSGPPPAALPPYLVAEEGGKLHVAKA